MGGIYSTPLYEEYLLHHHRGSLQPSITTVLVVVVLMVTSSPCICTKHAWRQLLTCYASSGNTNHGVPRHDAAVKT